VAVKANIGGGLTNIVIGVVALITSTIKIVKELMVFTRYKASKLKMFGVTIAKRV
jgi:hypothetical protein